MTVLLLVFAVYFDGKYLKHLGEHWHYRILGPKNLCERLAPLRTAHVFN